MEVGDRLVVDCHGQQVHLPTARAGSDKPTFLAGVRPEKIHLAAVGAAVNGAVPAATPGSANRLTGGVVTDASFTGVSTQYLVRMPWGQDLMVFAQNLGVEQRFAPGDGVDLVWESGHTFGLDGDATAGTGE